MSFLSQTIRSPTASTASSSNSSASSHSSQGQTPIPTPRKRPSKSDFTAYAALLRDFDKSHRQQTLSERLVKREASQRARLGGLVEDEDTASVTDGQYNEDLGRESEGEDQVDSQEEEDNEDIEQHEKSMRLVETETDDRWPLAPFELVVDHPSLQETIKTIASAYIRHNHLIPNNQLDFVVEDGTTDDGPKLPSDLVGSTVELVNRVLGALALMRPKEMKSRRKKLGQMDWKSVIGACGLINGVKDITHETNLRVREVFEVQDEDASASRLELIESMKTKRKRDLDEDLYGPVLPQRPKKRAHQSDAELQRRAEKRVIKEEKRRLTEEAKQTARKAREAQRQAKKAKLEVRERE